MSPPADKSSPARLVLGKVLGPRTTKGLALHNAPTRKDPEVRMAYKVRIWDLPTRLFHWLLVVSVVGLAATGFTGALNWHFRFGFAALTLLLFRLVWGFVGGRWSRFGAFLYRPSTVLAYLRGQAHPDHLIGHNPLGAASVFAMLLALAAQIGTGLLSDDEISFSGPLSRHVSNSTVGLATRYHAVIGIWIVIALAALHVAAVLFYLWRKKENLVAPMVRGDKALAAPAPASRDDAWSRLLALVLLCVCGGIVGWVFSLGGF